ncbi:MAG: acetate kinase [Clostridia bacterium]|nr:acetate kinase [Clostridia bacterium]
MKILVINCGSSSLKYQLFDMENESVIAKGNCEKIGLNEPFLKHKAKGQETILKLDMPTHKEAIENVLKILTDKEYGVIENLSEISAVGHRVLHGGEKFSAPVICDEKVIKELEELIPLGPLHMPANILGVIACKQVMPNINHVTVFDTAFHANMPDYAYMYGLPYEAYTDWKIRRYGFHGSSHRFVSNEAANYLNKDIKDLKIVTVHLGNGSSIAAVKGGVSVDTSMGFTPLEGLVMGTRCGDIDASIVGYIADKTGWTAQQVVTYLNKKSGMLGLNGVTSDSRENSELIEQGNKRAKLFVDMLAYKIKKYIGSYAAAMGGVDCIVFTGGIGENQEDVREYALEGLEFLGIDFDKEKNYNLKRGTTEELSKPSSKVKVLRIPTDEELVIARDTLNLTK